jgi:hypothetical protein
LIFPRSLKDPFYSSSQVALSQMPARRLPRALG